MLALLRFFQILPSSIIIVLSLIAPFGVEALLQGIYSSSSSSSRLVVVSAFDSNRGCYGSGVVRVRDGSGRIVPRPEGHALRLPPLLASLKKNNNNNDDDNNTKKSFRKRIVQRWTKTVGSRSDNNNNNEDEDDDVPPTTTTTPATPIGKGLRIEAIVDAAFGEAEDSLRDLEDSLNAARTALANAKRQSCLALEEAAGATAPEGGTAFAPNGINNNTINSNNSDINFDSLTFEDIDYESSEMAPPFLDQDSCLMPDADPLVRVEKAPENSRRIFAGIDILGASAEDVWNVLTKYDELQNVIPNLVVNEVLDLYEGSNNDNDDPSCGALEDKDLSEELRCANLSKSMKGSLLRQVGGAKVAGINFSAKTTLEVREWPNGMPDFAHFLDDMWEGKTREDRAKDYPKIKLKRYRFPRPFAVSNLPTKDISMQSIPNDDGEFRMYQGVWRMQPLVGCSPPGKDAMRLTYAVEISPRVYLPVKLIEGRIVRDLCSNLEAIREAVSVLDNDDTTKNKND